MDRNMLLLLYRAYLQSKGENGVEPCLLSSNFYLTDEKISPENWDFNKFKNNLIALYDMGYVKKYVDYSFAITDDGIDEVERYLRNVRKALS